MVIGNKHVGFAEGVRWSGIQIIPWKFCSMEKVESYRVSFTSVEDPSECDSKYEEF